MNLDVNRLIIQSDGDAGDSLANHATWAIACNLNPHAISVPEPRAWCWASGNAAIWAQQFFEIANGLYRRSPLPGWWNNPDTVTRDQLLGVILANSLNGLHRDNERLHWRIIKRFGFAQNKYRTGDDGVSQGKKTPDTFLGHFQFFVRPYPLLRIFLYPVLLVTDLIALLIKTPFAVIPYKMEDGGRMVKRSYGDVDIRNATLAHIMAMQMPTPFSWLSRQLFATFMSENFGMIHPSMWPRIEELNAQRPITREEFDAWLKHCPGEKNKVMAAWLWYFRASAKGNPEIAYAMDPVIYKYFRGF